MNLGKVATGDDCWGLVVDADLEARGAPVDELDRALRLDRGDGGVDVLGDDVSSVHHAARHVLVLFTFLISFLPPAKLREVHVRNRSSKIQSCISVQHLKLYLLR